jgi:hypothetical protein
MLVRQGIRDADSTNHSQYDDVDHIYRYSSLYVRVVPKRKKNVAADEIA